MTTKQSEFLTKLLKDLTKTDYIKPGRFPSIDLYMDQVTTFMNINMSGSKLKSDEKVLTKTMINNYAKNDLLPPPVNKKYSKEHLIVLTYIYYFKTILPISEIQAMINPLTDKFFSPASNKGHITLEYVYNEVLAAIKQQLSTVSLDVSKKEATAKEYFSDVKNPDDREFLQNFAMICMLGFDIFLKKQVLSGYIDRIAPKKNRTPHTPKK